MMTIECNAVSFNCLSKEVIKSSSKHKKLINYSMERFS